MNVDLSMYEPAELRLISKFVSELADIREQRNANLLNRFPNFAAAQGDIGPAAPEAPASENTEAKVEETKPAAEEKSKRTRKAKEEHAAAAAEEPANTQVQEEQAPDTAKEPETQKQAAEENFDEGNDTGAKDDVKVTHDDLRVLFGKLSQTGKRSEAIALFREKGYNGVGAVKDEDLYSVYVKLKELENGNA